MWWGKLFGAIFGYLIAGPLGLLLGLFVGSLFDKGYRGVNNFTGFGLNGSQQQRVQRAFFTATFSVMGHIAKADGRVSEDEIRLARTIMQRLRLSPAQQKEAIHLFNLGKESTFNLQGAVNEFAHVCGGQRILLRMFIEIQFQAAMADGMREQGKKAQILRSLCEQLGFSQLYNQYTHAGSYGQQNGGGYSRSYTSVSSISQAYSVLEINSTVTDAEVKKAYRKLMSQHHPDKLIAKGLPEEMIRVATDKTQKIQAAYEQIRTARGM